jgi:ABC-type phosphate/phosphonate transport system substrate-binding protein
MPASARRIASLGMYDLPWLHEANDALWQGIAQRLRAAGLRDVPTWLERERPLAALWRDPNLLLAQTCGYPLRMQLANSVRVVATPRYATEYGDGAGHRSALIVAHDAPWQSLAELRGRRVAVNELDSNSGMNLLRAAIAPLAGGQRFFAQVQTTGAHLASIDAVANGRADIAAIDSVTLSLIERHRPALLHGIRVLATTMTCPGLPLVTRIDLDEGELAALRAALHEAASDPTLADARAALLLDGFELLPDAAYDQVLRLERDAVALGYPALA